MKKIFMLLTAVLMMVITGCGSGSEAPLSSAKAITAFNIVSPVAATGVITEATHTIAITLPHGTSVTNLVATFTTTGTSVKVGSNVQTSGQTINDFTSPVTYTVTAADATTQDYKVTVTVSPLSGSLDTTFGKSGMVTTSIGTGDNFAYALGIQSDGTSDFKIVVAGSSYNSNSSKNDFALVRYNNDGSLDTGFGTGGMVTTSIGSIKDVANALAIQSNGTSDFKIVVAGSSNNSTSNKFDFALVRYNKDGSLDTTFGTGGIVTTSIGSGNDYANALAIQSDGTSDFKIVVAGRSFNSTSNKYDFALVRYNKDGSLDTTFGTGGIVTTSIGSIYDYAYALGIQPIGTSDVKIVVAGYSSTSNGSKYNIALAMYNTDGSLDTGFGTGGIVTTAIGSGYDSAHALAIQSDGTSDFKIVVAGSSSNGSKYNVALVRYNTDGSLDAGFGTGGIVTTPIGSGFDSAYALGIQPFGASDFRIVAAGYSNNGSDYDFALVRYNKDGSLDTGFGIGGKVTTPIGSSDDYALALGIQPVGTSDFRIVAAGYSLIGSNNAFALVGYLP